jgi:hypothetical protein
MTFPLRLGMGSFGGRELMGDGATTLIEDICCEKNPWLQLLGEATRLPKQNCAA